MKVKISVNKTPYSGYLNIDPDPKIEPDKKISDIVVHNITNLDEYLDDYECDEIIANELINYIKFADILPYLSLLKSKLKKGGTLVIGGIDLLSLNEDYLYGTLNEQDYNLFMFNSQEKPSLFYRSCVSLNILSEMCEKAGFKVINTFSENYKMHVKVIKNG